MQLVVLTVAAAAVLQLLPCICSVSSTTWLRKGLHTCCTYTAAAVLHFTLLYSATLHSLCLLQSLTSNKHICELCVVLLCCSFLNEFIMTFMFLFLVNMMTAR
jgi:hypothetical protein